MMEQFILGHKFLFILVILVLIALPIASTVYPDFGVAIGFLVKR